MKKDSHNYEHSHVHKFDTSERKNILIAFLLNISFVFIEIIGGLLSGSIAIISDAIHDLGDSFSLLITYILSLFATKGRDEKYTYGYRRILILGAMLNSVVLIVGSIYIFINAYDRFLHPEEINTTIMFVLAIIGIVVNGFSVFRMSKNTSLMSRSVMLHLLEDLLGWIAVFISSIVIYFFEFYRLDSILSFVIGGIILFNALRTLKETFEVLLQKVPDGIEPIEIENILCKNKEVIDVHDIHIWSLDGEDIIFSAHIVVKDDLNLTEIAHLKMHIKRELEEKGINHATLEVETNLEAINHGEIKI